MKNVITKTFLAILGFAFLFTLFSPTKLFAAEEKALNEKTIEIFTSDECEFCEELETELKKTYESSSYVLKNIDTSETNLRNFNIALVACGQEKGTVPMFLNGNICVTGKDSILEAFDHVNYANEIKTVSDADAAIGQSIVGVLGTVTDESFQDTMSGTDYILAGCLLLLLIAGIYLTARFAKSTNTKMKVTSVAVLVLAIAGFSGLLFMKVNSLNNLSSTGADAAKKASTCLETNTCKDWNEYVKAKAKIADDEGDSQTRKLYEEKVVDQKLLDAQISATNSALIETLKKNPTLCSAAETATSGGCTYAAFLRTKQTEASQKVTSAPPASCSSDPDSSKCSADKKAAETKEYLTLLYGFDKSDPSANKTDTARELKGEIKDVLTQYMNDKLKEAVDGYLNGAGGTLNQVERTSLINACIERSTTEAAKTACSTTADRTLLNLYGFSPIITDNYTGLGVYVLSQALRSTVRTDECLVPTSGDKCPAGTYGCECQTTPVYRAVCIVAGQNCQAVCQATHNVCENCSSRTITEEDIENPPPTTPPPTSTAVCQESCSETTPCNDGTSCVNGRCINESCPDDEDCMCNTTTPICGDGIINNSPQAPEQCELGNPPGTSCDWNTCNQNSCTCPDTNPSWDIEKTSSVICINENTANASAQVKFNISATYINEDDPTEVGILERVVDRPQNYLATWLDASSISNGGTHTIDGDLVDEIRWDLTGTLSQFTIPSGQTEVTKSNFLSYTFNLPKAYFGRYVNLVTGYPNQENDDDSFSYTHSVYIGCNVPSTSTSLTPQNLAKIFVGVFVVLVGLMFALSQAGNSTIEGVVNSSAYAKAQLFFTPKAKREDVAKEQFERKVLGKK